MRLAIAALALLPLWTAVAAGAATELEEIGSLIEVGRHAEALERLQAVLESDPDDAQALFLKGIALAESGRLEEAVEVLTRLTQTHPGLPGPFNNLAVLHAMRGELEAARDALLDAIEAHPGEARYHENLADVYLELAGRSYRRALDLAPSQSQAANKLSRLEAVFSEDPADGPAAGESDAAEAEMKTETELAVAGAPACVGAVDRVEAWAEAWARQDVEGYLGAYAPEFAPGAGVSRSRWEATRRRRIESPAFIEVTLRDLEVELCAERRARVGFTQIYRSDTYHDQVRKDLWLSRPEEEWVILDERVRE